MNRFMSPGSVKTNESMEPWVDRALSGTVYLTSNRRAARFLRHAVAQHALARGDRAWPSPIALPFNDWLREAWTAHCWQQGLSDVLLSAGQEHMLWRKVIRKNAPVSPLNDDALAELAQQAWTRLHEYADGPAALRRYSAVRTDWSRFNQWCNDYARELKRAGFVTSAELPGRMVLAAEAGWTPNGPIVLWGFDNLPPAQARMVATLQRFVQVERAAPSVQAPEPDATILEFASRADEINAAALWAAEKLQHSPDARLAILTTKTETDRGEIYRALSGRMDAGQFEFALGAPLEHHPLVRIALRLLRWMTGRLVAPDISDLLISRFLCESESDQHIRARFETSEFRRAKVAEPAMDLTEFIAWLTAQMQKRSQPAMARLLRQCNAARQTIPNRTSPLTAEDCADRFRAILGAFDFPSGFGTHSSEDYQTADRWSKLLDDFSSLSPGGERYTFREALGQLERMAKAAPFQPESHDAPVQIMGPLEAAGSLFDGVFFIGCTDDRWPIPLQLHPLLSTELQSAYGMPGAVRGAGMTEARIIADRICRSSTETKISWAATGSDGKARPSGALRESYLKECALEETDQLYPRPASPRLEIARHPDASPLRWSHERGAISSSVLKSQGACPFQAYASRRLHARDVEYGEEGFDALQRGILVHDVLRLVWDGPEGLRSLSGLLAAMTGGTLDQVVRDAAETAISAIGNGWPREMALLERTRVSALVLEWLTEVEVRRSDFAVFKTEEELSFDMTPELKLNLRLDRVDELLEDGQKTNDPRRRILLDYKTGKVDKKLWELPRMDDPQLPLYAVFAMETPPLALALAQIKAGEPFCMIGRAAGEDVLRLKNDDVLNPTAFDDQLRVWREDIEKRAEGFVAGDATVDPKHGDATCKYCGLQPLCRVHEADVLLDDDAGDDEGADSGQ